MKRNSWLVAGLAFLLGLSACSKETKKITSVGSYAPVISGLHMDHEPAVRGVQNELTVLVTNVNGIPLTYHWRASGGVLQDSTASSVTWDAPDTIGNYEVYVSVEGTDTNDVPYFRERIFPVYVDNEFERWTGTQTVKYDVSPPPGQAPDAVHPVLFAEFEDQSTGESHVASIVNPMGAISPLSDAFFAAASPSLQADGSQIAFVGRAQSTAPSPSIYVIPGTGAQTDTTNATAISRYRPTGNNRVLILEHPRFAPTGATLAFESDSETVITRQNNQHLYLKDTSNYFLPAQPLITGSLSTGEGDNRYQMPGWNAAGDSLLCVSANASSGLIQRGLFKLSTVSPYQATGTVWLADPDARDPEWSPDGQYVAFTRTNRAGDRDIWIIRTDATNPSQAVRITRGPADDGNPRFSFDGTKIYFVSNRADRYGLNGVFSTERRGFNVWTVSRFDRP